MRWKGADGIPLQKSGKQRGPVKTVMSRVGLRKLVMILLDIVTNLLEPNSLTYLLTYLVHRAKSFLRS